VTVLIYCKDRFGVAHVKQVHGKAEGLMFSDPPRVVSMQIDLTGGGRATQNATASNRDLAGILVDRMVGELADRCSALDTDACSKCQVLQRGPRECVAEE